MNQTDGSPQGAVSAWRSSSMASVGVPLASPPPRMTSRFCSTQQDHRCRWQKSGHRPPMKRQSAASASSSRSAAEDWQHPAETDLEALRRRAAHAGPIDDDTLVYRIEFHAVH